MLHQPDIYYKKREVIRLYFPFFFRSYPTVLAALLFIFPKPFLLLIYALDKRFLHDIL